MKKVVTHHAKRDRTTTKDIETAPEMQELKHMIRTDELKPHRIKDFLKSLIGSKWTH